MSRSNRDFVFFVLILMGLLLMQGLFRKNYQPKILKKSSASITHTDSYNPVATAVA